MKPYVIKQGDYLTKLAFTLGFDASVVWRDAANKALKDRRPDPDLLCPGDVLFVPDRAPRAIPLATHAVNRLAATVPTVKIDLSFQNRVTGPLANEPYVIAGLADDQSGVTDSNGRVTFEAPVTAREVEIIFPNSDIAYPVRIGNLDPIEEPSGVRMRLEHLGYSPWYLAGQPVRPADENPEWDRYAIAAFQSDQKLPETGEMDAATCAALVRVHGS